MYLAERIRPSTLFERRDQIQTRCRVVRVDSGGERREQTTHARCIALRASGSIASQGFTVALHGSNAVAFIVRIAVRAQ